MDEEIGCGGGAENEALRPIRRKAGVVVRVEMGKKVGDGGGGGEAESVDEEASSGDELGQWERGGERERGGLVMWRDSEGEGSKRVVVKTERV